MMPLRDVPPRPLETLLHTATEQVEKESKDYQGPLQSIELNHEVAQTHSLFTADRGCKTFTWSHCLAAAVSDQQL